MKKKKKRPDANRHDIIKLKLDCAKIILKSEQEREKGMISQAAHLQTANSIVLAATTVIAGIIYESKSLSLALFLLVFASISLMLGTSLFFATMAQGKSKRLDYPDIDVLISNIDQHEAKLKDNDYLQSLYKLQLLSPIQKAISNMANSRCIKLKIATACFYTALALCVIWFFIILLKII